MEKWSENEMRKEKEKWGLEGSWEGFRAGDGLNLVQLRLLHFPTNNNWIVEDYIFRL